MKKILIVLAEGFEEVEAIGTADFLIRAGFTVRLAGLNDMAVTGSHGVTVLADKLFAEAVPAEVDALVLPGGMPGAANLRDSDMLLNAVRNIHQTGKIVAAICAAPMVLARAGLLANLTFTAFPGVDLGIPAKPTGKPVECENRIITARGPGLTFAFAARIAKELGHEAAAKKVWQEMLLP